jgi:hydrogenase maturation protein HypF
MTIKCARIHISGIVQGVGFRPFVYGLATRLGLAGWVRNTSAGVDIEVDGLPETLDDFVQSLRNEAPPLSHIDELTVAYTNPHGFSNFEIIHSEAVPGDFIPISPDVSICEDCLRELFDPADRRYRYPFINCTNCGPRFTIIQDIPYDRPKTTMARFAMCPQCAAEYQNPLDRRFHAQPVACPVCGPQVWLEMPTRMAGMDMPRDKSPAYSAEPDQSSFSEHPESPVLGRQPDDPVTNLQGKGAIQQARQLLKAGKILAIKGLGGFHLACDATNPAAVEELRRRKLRVDKPFALMMPDVEMVELHCLISPLEHELLLSRQRPIVILRRRPQSPIATAIAPGQNTIGVMLPYTPLHYLLFAASDPQSPAFDMPPLVMTSGNLSEEPICTGNQEARQRLASLADAFLMHDREIHTRCDDSVVRMFPATLTERAARRPSSLYLLRRSRGYAPDPVRLAFDALPLLATGAELKNTFCLARQRYAFLSHHIGDLENYETLRAFEQGIVHFEKLFRIQPQAIAYDLHPDYLSTRYALERSCSENLPAIGVQHHHAHIAACMAEHGLSGDQPVIGVAFDGTGYGEDGAIWGGEFLIADYRSSRRAAHLAYSPLPGGDQSIRHPWRTALAFLYAANLPWDKNLSPMRHAASLENQPVPPLEALRVQLEKRINTPNTSSMGRLFDAVAALLGIRQDVNYEAQAAIEMEALADLHEPVYYPVYNEIQAGEIPVAPLLSALLEDMQAGISVAQIAARFHATLAMLVSNLCARLSAQVDSRLVVLSGGVWQNSLLLAQTVSLLQQNHFEVFVHRQVPTNDGGISLGQAAVAIARLNS